MDKEPQQGSDAEPFLVFGAPQIEDAEVEEVVATMRSGWLGTGPRVARFESEFGRYKQTPNAVAVSSCTAALHLSILASGIGPGDEVITTALTFCATVNAILHTGATPVLVDVDPATMNLDISQVAARVGERTRAVLPVHFAGRPCDMDPLIELCARKDLLLIEDCAHAVEATYREQSVGTFGDFGCFSFYVTKNVITGEGGMVLTRRGDHAAKVKMLALHGMSADAWKRFGDEGYQHYTVVECGFKYNMMDLQAAIGLHQLARVTENHARRSDIWSTYDDSFSGLPIETPSRVEPRTQHAFHLYTILIDEKVAGISRDAFLTEMTRKGIGLGVHYLSLGEHPYYQAHLGWRAEEQPNAMRIGRQTVSLPLSANLTDHDIERVIDAVRACVG